MVQVFSTLVVLVIALVVALVDVQVGAEDDIDIFDSGITSDFRL